MARPWTIGIDVRGADEIRVGRGRVARELIAALAAREDDHRYVLYRRKRVWDVELDDRFSWRERELADPGWLLWAAASAGRHCDAFLSINSYLASCWLRIPSVIVVYDLVAFLPGVPAQRRPRRIERMTLRPALHWAQAVICVSGSTRTDLIARYPSAASKTTVVPLAAGPPFGSSHSAAELARTLERYGLPDAFVLSVGALTPRKNLRLLIEAHAQLPDDLRGRHPLVLAGPNRGERGVLAHEIAARGAEVRLLGHVPDDDLAALYQCCTVFCYPSLYEGFGLPVLEAMRCGAPTITSNTSSLPEIGGDGARYVDPRSAPEICDALRELLRSDRERAQLAGRGRERAAAFSWARTAAQTLAVLESLRH